MFPFGLKADRKIERREGPLEWMKEERKEGRRTKGRKEIGRGQGSNEGGE
jgi:hypothetical protein